MKGKKNIVLTGGNAGIGYQTAKGLYSDGHHLIFGSRNQSKNLQAVKSITQAFPNSTGTIKSLKLDLSKKASIQQFSSFVKSQFDHVDILINNAGLILNDLEISELGVEMTMTINHFGHFYLTYLLFPLIKISKEARIINVSSTLHFRAGRGIFDDLDLKDQSYGSFSQYSKSKLANVEFTVALAFRLAKYPNIKTVSLHPGVVESNFGVDLWSTKCFRFLTCCCSLSNEEGARTSLYLARSQFGALRSGQYYDSDTTWKEMNEVAREKSQTERLWKQSERLLQIQFQV